MKNSLKIIVSIIITIYVAWSAFEYDWYSGIIPAKIDITYAIHIGGESYFREGCGAAIFRLSNATADAIDREGLDFFNDVIYSRKSKERYYTYTSWKETPVPNSWTSEGSWPGLGCSGASSLLLSKILAAASKKGSYYSTQDEGKILVIPNQKLVVFTYFG
ncbi:hypothetical protein [Nostoc sp. UIC 10630]|uniref:hypothetical protein n=1 Tax=Nostoc sp. UIC 10630 TaxID=2100146 RepID=UPI0013D77491|nr:hypothetical protein [Nostoc sp. UIC 10630]NEU82092.1 hypothetical protein [Nostoc sp. UIC 10630]